YSTSLASLHDALPILENPLGLHASFYEVEGDLLVAVFHPRPQHQGYPERLHGGMAATILDETLGRSILVHHDGDLWGVTVDLERSEEHTSELQSRENL